MGNFCLSCDWLVNDEELAQITALLELVRSHNCRLHHESRITTDGHHIETFIVSASDKTDLENFTKEAKAQTIFFHWIERKTLNCPDYEHGLEKSPPSFLNRTYDGLRVNGLENKRLQLHRNVAQEQYLELLHKCLSHLTSYGRNYLSSAGSIARILEEDHSGKEILSKEEKEKWLGMLIETIDKHLKLIEWTLEERRKFAESQENTSNH
jgi:hypothetical protein